MSDQLYSTLARMPARQLRLMAGGVLAIALMATWALALRAPWQALRAAQTRLAAAAPVIATVPTPVPVPAANASDRAAARPAGPTTVLALIGALDASARRNGVAVTATAPLPIRVVAGLSEVPLDVQASGTYAALQAWLADIGREVPTAAVGRIDLLPGSAPDRRAARVHVALYLAAVQP